MAALGVATSGVTRGLQATAAWSSRAAVGLVGLAAYAGKLGVEFNATMESQRIAFSSFLGSTRRADAYLRDLYRLTPETPFEFTDVVKGSRTSLAFGVNADEAQQTLTGLGDAVAAMAGGADEIHRTTFAIGQIQAAGVVHAQDLNQLISAGVVALPKLSRRWACQPSSSESRWRWARSTPTSSLRRCARCGPTTPIYKGAAAKQAGTFYRQLSTLHDATVQTLGTMTKPLFGAMRDDALPAFTGLADDLNRNPRASVAVRFRTVAAGGIASSFDRRTSLIVRSERRWRKLWRQLTAGHDPVPEPPRVDFTREMLLLVTQGRRPEMIACGSPAPATPAAASRCT